MAFGGGYQHRPINSGQSQWQGWFVEPAQPDAAQPATPYFPDRADAAKRASVQSYQVVVNAMAVTATQPAAGGYKVSGRSLSLGGGYFNRPSFDGSPPLQGWTTQPAQPDAIQPSGSPVYPVQAPGQRRAASGYDVSLHQFASTVVTASPAIKPVFPDRAPGPLRSTATSYAISTHAAQSNVIVVAMPGRPVFLDQAPGFRRASVDSYQLSVSPVPVQAQSLGRFRLGDQVPLVYQADASIASAPVAVITGPNGVVDQPVMSTRGGYTFHSKELLTEAFPLGNYTVNILGDLFTFTVVAGGDPASNVIAMNYGKNVQGHQMLVQTRRGELLLGTNPNVSG